jgi:hypothetical protein
MATTKNEAREIERQRAARAAALSDATTKKLKAEADESHKLHVWCPLRDQFIDRCICARMQSQKRIRRVCVRARCKHTDADWAERLTAARRKDDPNDETLGYLKTEQFRVITTKAKRKK